MPCVSMHAGELTSPTPSLLLAPACKCSPRRPFSSPQVRVVPPASRRQHASAHHGALSSPHRYRRGLPLSSCPHTLYARPYQLCARTSSAPLITLTTHHPHHPHHPHAPLAHASHALHSQRAIEDPEHEPMRRPNSYLPWRSDGRCSDYEMTTGLDLSRMGYLQVWELRTSKSIPSLRLLLHHDQSSPTLTR